MAGHAASGLRNDRGRRHVVHANVGINEKNKNQEPYALGKSGKLRTMNLKGNGFCLSILTF